MNCASSASLIAATLPTEIVASAEAILPVDCGQNVKLFEDEGYGITDC